MADVDGLLPDLLLNPASRRCDDSLEVNRLARRRKFADLNHRPRVTDLNHRPRVSRNVFLVSTGTWYEDRVLLKPDQEWSLTEDCQLRFL